MDNTMELGKNVLQDVASPMQYTVEEMKNVLKESETDFNIGNTHTSKEVFNEIEKEFPWLCK